MWSLTNSKNSLFPISNLSKFVKNDIDLVENKRRQNQSLSRGESKTVINIIQLHKTAHLQHNSITKFQPLKWTGIPKCHMVFPKAILFIFLKTMIIIILLKQFYVLLQLYFCHRNLVALCPPKTFFGGLWHQQCSQWNWR